MLPTEIIENGKKKARDLAVDERAIIIIGGKPHKVRRIEATGYNEPILKGVSPANQLLNINTDYLDPGSEVEVIVRRHMTYDDLEDGSFYVPHDERALGVPTIKNSSAQAVAGSTEVTLLKNVEIQEAPIPEVEIGKCRSGQMVKVEIGGRTHEGTIGYTGGGTIRLSGDIRVPCIALCRPFDRWHIFDDIPLGTAVKAKGDLVGVKNGSHTLLIEGPEGREKFCGGTFRITSSGSFCPSMTSMEEVDNSLGPFVQTHYEIVDWEVEEQIDNADLFS